jgi:hypothetical protein
VTSTGRLAHDLGHHRTSLLYLGDQRFVLDLEVPLSGPRDVGRVDERDLGTASVELHHVGEGLLTFLRHRPVRKQLGGVRLGRLVHGPQRERVGNVRDVGDVDEGDVLPDSGVGELRHLRGGQSLRDRIRAAYQPFGLLAQIGHERGVLIDHQALHRVVAVTQANTGHQHARRRRAKVGEDDLALPLRVEPAARILHLAGVDLVGIDRAHDDGL